jgi:hypothetical protein
MKLHELLAVETNHENQANKTRTELANSFEKKRHLFEEKRVVFTPLGEGQSVVETQSDIQSTVQKELNWVQEFAIKSLDASYQVAEANTSARADVVLEDDTVLLTGVPATALLELEKRMAELTSLITAIPTLDPAKGFSPDSQRGEGYFQARPVRKTRSKKEKVVIVKYDATPEHPAQTELIDKDVVVGTIEEQEWSSLFTPAQKSELLNRVEIVSRAVRRARSRANEVEVDKNAKIGKKLLGYIFGKV